MTMPNYSAPGGIPQTDPAAGAAFAFNSGEYAPLASSEPLPAGWYDVRIIGSQLKRNSKNDGDILVFTYEVISGEHAKRQLFDNLNIRNPNPTAQEIANRTLSSICLATGVHQITTTTAVLHGIPFSIRVVLRPAGAGNDGKYYEASNNIKDYKALQNNVQVGGAAAAVAPPAATPYPTAPQAPASPAWQAPQAPVPPAAQAPVAPPAQQWTPPAASPAQMAPPPVAAPPAMPAQPAPPAAAVPPSPPAPPAPPEGQAPWMQQQQQAAPQAPAAVPPWGAAQ